MIRYALACEHEHAFEAWFGSSGDYDDQAARGLVECPYCASRAVRKQIMAPAVLGGRAAPEPASSPSAGVLSGLPDPPAEIRAMMTDVIGKMRDYVQTHFDNVGDRFASVARDIHEGREEPRGVYGQATPEEVKALVEDGVPVAPLPDLAPPRHKLN